MNERFVWFAAAAAVLTYLAAGCSGSEKPTHPGEVEFGEIGAGPAFAYPDSVVFDSWVLGAGSILSGILPGATVTALEIEDNGLASVYFHDLFTDAKDCARAFALYDGRNLAFDFTREPRLFAAEPSQIFPIVVVEKTFMGLADDTGRIGLLSREPVPISLRCQPLPISRRWDSLPAPNFFSDVVLYEGDLVYSGPEQIHRFDPVTGTLGTPLDETNRRHVQSTQDGDFWTHCGCGGSPEAVRTDLVSVFDTVHTGDDLNRPIVIRGAAVEPATGYLWLHGTNQDAFESFLVVDAEAEPDVLVRRISFDRPIDALAFEGEDLWAIVRAVSPSVVRIDASTGRAVETYEVPDDSVRWTGLVLDGSTIYLLGIDEDGTGVIVESRRRTG